MLSGRECVVKVVDRLHHSLLDAVFLVLVFDLMEVFEELELQFPEVRGQLDGVQIFGGKVEGAGPYALPVDHG